VNYPKGQEVGLEVNAGEIICNQPTCCEFALQTLCRNMMIC